MSVRTIAIVDCPDATAHLFRSILRIVRNKTRVPWEIVASTDRADVVLSSDGRGAGGKVASGATRHVAVVEPGAEQPGTPHVLVNPFRVMQVLNLLDTIADELDNGGGQDSPGASTSNDAAWRFALSLRSLASRAHPERWYSAAVEGHSELWVRGDLGACACDENTARRIRAQATDIGAVTATGVASPPHGLRTRPVSDLLWFVGYHGVSGLAPWLDANAAYRIRQWPDFGVIPATPVRLRLAAMLSLKACTRAELLAGLEESAEEIDRILNALAVTGLLNVNSVAASEPEPEAAPRQVVSMERGIVKSFIRGLRSRLGIGS